MASRLTPSYEVRISCLPYHSWTPVDQPSRISLPTSSPGSLPGQHKPTGLARLFALAKLPPNPLGNTAGQRPGQPHQRRPSPKKQPETPHRQREGQTEPETTDCRPDTRAESDSTTTRGYASATAPPPPPSKNNRGILLRHGQPERPGHRTRPGNRRTLYQVYDKPVHPLFCNFWSYGYHCRYRIPKHTIFTVYVRTSIFRIIIGR